MQNLILPIQSVTSMATTYKDSTKIQLLKAENQIPIRTYMIGATII